VTDEHIIDLYWNRSEQAIAVTDDKYGKMCNGIAYRILNDREDSEECVNDGYLRLWNSIPPQRPKSLPAFLGKIVRNLALNCYEKRNASKRGGGEVPLALEELAGCIPSGEDPMAQMEEKILRSLISGFISGMKKEDRVIFLLRYWELQPVVQIAELCRCSESKVKMSLHRSRKKLRSVLEREGVAV
jgi:RNA polymerase sigma-70 factor (ECF subfamily)